MAITSPHVCPPATGGRGEEHNSYDNEEEVVGHSSRERVEDSSD